MNKEERQARQDYYGEVHAIFEALEAAGHAMYEAARVAGNSAGSYPRHRTELPWNWFDYQQGSDPFDTPAVVYNNRLWDSFGQFRIVAKIEGTELGYHTDWSGPRALIFEQVSTGRCFRVTGKNKSHVGEDWDYPEIREVTGAEKTLRVWEVVER